VSFPRAKLEASSMPHTSCWQINTVSLTHGNPRLD
jgi:hypothetical protein